MLVGSEEAEVHLLDLPPWNSHMGLAFPLRIVASASSALAIVSILRLLIASVPVRVPSMCQFPGSLITIHESQWNCLQRFRVSYLSLPIRMLPRSQDPVKISSSCSFLQLQPATANWSFLKLTAVYCIWQQIVL